MKKISCLPKAAAQCLTMCHKVLAWNCHSFASHKKAELKNLLSKSPHEIICLSETWMKPDYKLSLSGYECFRQDRARGGVAILLNNRIPHKNTFKISLNYAEAVTVELEDATGVFKVSSIYCSPSCTRAEAKTFFDKVMSLPGRHIITGDFNAKHTSWGNRKNCRKGIDIFNLCSSKNYSIFHPKEATSIPPNGQGSIIDFAISRLVPNVTEPVIIKDLPSDHFPISFSILSASKLSEESKFYNTKKANWKQYRVNLESDLFATLVKSQNINSDAEVDECIDEFSKAINLATDRAIPKCKQFSHRHPFSQEIKNLTKHRNFFRNQFVKFRRASDKSCMNQLNRMIKYKIFLTQQESFNSKLNSLLVQDNSIWKFTKELKSKNSGIPPLELENNKLACTDSEKSMALAEAFHKAHSITATMISDHEQEVKKSKDVIDNMSILTVEPACRHTTSLHIKELIKSLKPKKAPGSDKITNLLLKNLPGIGFQVLTNILNRCLDLAYFPSSWKVAKIIAIPKPGKNSKNPTNYRPISLLSCVGKLYEKIILERLSDHEENNEIFIKEQFGFVRERGTVQQVLRVTQKAAINFNKKKSTGLVMLDLEKAFDSVWHQGLLHKLLINGYPIKLVKLIASYLHQRSAYVECKSAQSPFFHIAAGVPQGSILSPHLFNIFINDIPTPHKCELAMFADDTMLICEVPWRHSCLVTKILTEALETVSDFFESWKIRLNKNKTEFIILTKSPKMIRKLNENPPTFQNEIFAWKPTVKYLGVILDQKLLFRAHVENVIQKAKTMLYKTLYCIMKRNNSTPVQTKIQVYRSVIRPIMTYACPVFSNCAKSHFNKLQVVQNSALRLALNAEWCTPLVELHLRSKVPTLREYVDKITNNFYSKASCHDNPLINSLGNYSKDNLGFVLKHRLPLNI